MSGNSAAVLFHGRYLSLVDHIERNFPVAAWKADDLQIWPLARMDLYLDLYRSSIGIAPFPRRSLTVRALERFATPLLNLWNSRHDLSHWIARPRPAHVAFLGDGVSLDWIDGRWRDRYGEPLMAALQRRGQDTFLMQSGDLSRLPWHRSTYAANIVAFRGLRHRTWISASLELPEHTAVIQYLVSNGVAAPSLEREKLLRRSHVVLSTASEFQRVLRIVQPTLGFVVTYYANLGPAFLLACRRQCVLSIDLQHCPQEGAHKAYGWSAVPVSGYATLPAVFWNWTAADAEYIRQWTDRLPRAWHRSLHGGHTQLTPYLDESDPATKAMDGRYDAISGSSQFEREILVALQPVTGYRAQWASLAEQIASSPREWRWWIRRHPASRPYQDQEYLPLVQLRLPNVVVDASLSLPLPTLLRRMSVLVSRFSGAAVEAASFGVPALFLSEEARGQFSGLIERGCARVVELSELLATIARLPKLPVRPRPATAPDLDETLLRLEQMAREYRKLCQSTG
jgi:hypothetical protein